MMHSGAELTGWQRTLHLKFRFGLAKLPLWPVRYRLQTPGYPDFFYRWTRVMPFMDPVRGAFDFELYGWDVRELRFLRRHLGPGMKFIDVGAHHGFYSVLARTLVAGDGRVLAIEPSPRCVRRLRWHLRLNHATDVDVWPVAVGARRQRSGLFVPTRGVDTTSSLRLNAAGPCPQRIDVEVFTLDEIVAARGLRAVDLVKLDVEGAESAVLDGATHVLRNFAPLWIFEALDVTAAAWGTSGRDLVARFVDMGHAVFEFREDGRLGRHQLRSAYPLDSNCNLLAVPINKCGIVAALEM